MNRLFISGNLTKDPIIFKNVTKLSIAVDRDDKDKKSDFFLVTVFKPNKTFVDKYLYKGRHVEIEAVLENNLFESDGLKSWQLEIICKSLRATDKPDKNKFRELVQLDELEDEKHITHIPTPNAIRKIPIAFKGLTFTAIQPNSTISLNRIGNMEWTGEYSLDNTIWEPYSLNTKITLPNIGDTVRFIGVYRSKTDSNNHLHFQMSGNLVASGDLLSIYCGENFLDKPQIKMNYIFYKLFYNCSSLLSPPILSAQILSDNCYESIFENCTSMTTLPMLPVLCVGKDSYKNMFKNCRSLYISDYPDNLHNIEYSLPNNQLNEPRYYQPSVFTGCLGKRRTDDIDFTSKDAYITYFIHNQPVYPFPKEDF